jgi:hypothetical protein
MEKLSAKEKMVFRFIFSEKRVYRHWYSRFLYCGVHLERIYNKRICCAVGNGGPAHLRDYSNERRVNPILLKELPYLAGTKTYKESLERVDIDIKKAPPMDRPLLIFHSGEDKLIPSGKKHADYFMEWAIGEKELCEEFGVKSLFLTFCLEFGRNPINGATTSNPI